MNYSVLSRDATCIAWTVLMQDVRPSVCLSVCLSRHYLTLNIRNGTRYRHCYHGTQIGTYMRPTQGCHFE